MQVDRNLFLEQGFLIVEEAIPQYKLEKVRKAYEILVEKQRLHWKTYRKKGGPLSPPRRRRRPILRCAKELDEFSGDAEENQAEEHAEYDKTVDKRIRVPDAGCSRRSDPHRCAAAAGPPPAGPGSRRCRPGRTTNETE